MPNSTRHFSRPRDTVIKPSARLEEVIAFDTGPGNMVMDQLTGSMDRGGKLGSQGHIDRKLLDFVATRLANGSVKLLALLTKVDKLNRNETTAALKAAGDVLGEVVSESSDVSLTPFSALSRAGVDDAARVLYAWPHPTP